jgi:hypothetical protein
LWFAEPAPAPQCPSLVNLRIVGGSFHDPDDPPEIVSELDKHIVGQGRAKKAVAVACATAGGAPRWPSR